MWNEVEVHLMGHKWQERLSVHGLSSLLTLETPHTHFLGYLVWIKSTLYIHLPKSPLLPAPVLSGTVGAADLPILLPTGIKHWLLLGSPKNGGPRSPVGTHALSHSKVGADLLSWWQRKTSFPISVSPWWSSGHDPVRISGVPQMQCCVTQVTPSPQHAHICPPNTPHPTPPIESCPILPVQD